MTTLRKRKAARSGQALVEYSVLMLLGACFCFAALRFLGQSITSRLMCFAQGIAPGNYSNVTC